MEEPIAVFNSDIARLVLQYLVNQRLKRASRIFCKTSPHLDRQFDAYKYGLRIHSFFPDLEEIICEYVKISHNVQQVVSKVSESSNLQFNGGKLSEQIMKILDRFVELNVNQSSKNTKNNTCPIQSDKENKRTFGKNIKRKHYHIESSDDDQQRSSSFSYRHKRKRTHETLRFIVSNGAENFPQGKNLTALNRLISLDTSDNSEEEDEGDSTSNEGESPKHVDEISVIDKPSKQSTPHRKERNNSVPSIQDITQSILDNQEFQIKLVSNINSALKVEDAKATENIETAKNVETVNTNDKCETEKVSNEPAITSSQLLDELVKNILDSIERDPAFDEIVQDAVDIANKPVVSSAIKCDKPSTSQVIHKTQNSAEVNTDMDILNTAVVNTSFTPQTPVIIRDAVAAANAAIAVNNNESIGGYPILSSNTSIQSLNNDPNYSISKLIFFNSNDNSQKQQFFSNVTAESLLNELNTAAVDISTGQLTFPVVMTQDGGIANIPFLFNNDMIAQQLLPENISNLQGSQIEIFPEPIVVPTDNFVTNCKIITNGSIANIDNKQEILNQEEQQASFKEKQLQLSKNCAEIQQGEQEESQVEQQQNSASQLNMQQKQQQQQQAQILCTITEKKKECVEASSNSAVQLSGTKKEDVTPSTSGRLNVKAFRSLSTPRKREAHVRALSFSPRTSTISMSLTATPLSTRRGLLNRLQPQTKIEQEAVTDKPIIKNVEILPRLPVNAIDISNNDSSSSCNVPPLFAAGEENSNQTIIKGHFSKKDETEIKTNVEPFTNQNNETNTPKRKQSRRAAVKKCKRQLSKSSNEEINETTQESDNKESKQEPPCSSQDNDKDATMEEWLRLRSQSTNDLDSRLREINSKMGIKRPMKTKKNVRRRKTPATRKKEKAAAEAAGEELEHANENSINECNEEEMKIESGANNNAKEKKQPSKPKECSTKIKTSQKGTKDKIEEDKVKLNKSNESTGARDQNIDKTEDTSLFFKPVNQVSHVQNQELLMREKRTVNIACLLDTPFKEVNSLNLIPPTPGVSISTLDTPSSKFDSRHAIPHSHSFLFGSMSKSIIETPLHNIRTPGFSFSLSSKEGTPRTASTTEYSSGGSYYKPDESIDLDNNIEKLLLRSEQMKQVEDEPDEYTNKSPINSEELELEAKEPVYVEIPVEKLKVEPVLLERIKSFGSDCGNQQDDAHYTLASGLPDIVEDAESSSSSSSDSSSSSSSSNTSSINSDSSFTSDADNNDLNANKNSNKKKISSLTLQNCSDISSAEDDDWAKEQKTKEETSPLVSESGEVRYPVRSWLTPCKDVELIEKISPIMVNLSLKSVEKHKQQITELMEKRERVKAKLKHDYPIKPTQPPANVPVRKTKKFDQSTTVSTPSKKLTYEQSPDPEIFNALSLSAKKKSPNIPSTVLKTIQIVKGRTASPKPPLLGDIDDNAVSHIIEKEHKSNLKVSQRQCVQIESLPMMKRGKSKSKKIVRTQLGFKGPASAASTVPAKVEPATVLENVVILKKSAVSPTSPIILPKKMVTTKPAGTGKETVTKSSQRKHTEKDLPLKTESTKIEQKARKTAKPVVIRPISARIATRLAKKQAIEEIQKSKMPKKKSTESKSPKKKPTQMFPNDEKSTDNLPKKRESPQSRKPESPKIFNQSKANEIEYKVIEIDITPNKQPSKTSTPSRYNFPKNDDDDDDDDVGFIKSIDNIGLKKNTAESIDTDTRTKANDSPNGEDYYSLEDVHFTDNDIIFVKYDESNTKLTKKSEINDKEADKLVDYKMILCINDEEHVLKSTNETCLFESEPKPTKIVQLPLKKSTLTVTHMIRNIPKKRQIRISSSSNGEDICAVQRQPQTSLTHTDLNAKIIDTSTEAKKYAMGLIENVTSSADQQQLQKNEVEQQAVETVDNKTVQKSDDQVQQQKQKQKQEKIFKEAASANDDTSTDPTKKIHIGDIESILSHLHGMK